MKETDRQFDLAGGSQTQACVRAYLDAQFGRGGLRRHFDFDKGRRSLGLGAAGTPRAKGGIAKALLPGKGGSGQSAAIKRGQKLSASAGRRARSTLTQKSI